MTSNKLVDSVLESAGITLNGSKPYDIRVHDKRLFHKLLFEPTLAAGEGYMEGWWDCDQLDELFFRICRNKLDDKIYGNWILVFRNLAASFFNMQTRLRSKKVADVHYNLGNALYQFMLGETMAYTCAYWKNADNLDQAQYDKFDLICRKIDLRPEDRVLDLGCGWGTLAKFMAEKYGCSVVAVNISEEQIKWARDHTKGLPVQFHLCDYRDAHIYNPQNVRFDKIVSIGLCEHVGHKNYQPFMEIARANIKESGLFLLHTIGNNITTYCANPWITKYIFPNGMLPSVKLLSEAWEKHFVLEDFHNFGADYDKTLMAWHKNFNAHWHLISHDYDDRFYRMWNYYLLSCAGGFRARGMQLWQMVLSPHGVMGGYQSVR